jgi:dynein heavy chain
METVLSVWLEVQNKWCELEEMFSTSEVLLNLPHDAYRFVTVGKEFSELLKKTSKNPNILQCCCKDGYHSIDILNVLFICCVQLFRDVA